MKVTNCAVALALLYSSEVSAVQLKEKWGQQDDGSYSDYDKEYKPTALAEQMQNEKYQTPYGLAQDDDGVHDNVKKTQGELDKFGKPVFHPVEEIHNTRHGNLPGHVRDGENPEPKLLAGAKP